MQLVPCSNHNFFFFMNKHNRYIKQKEAKDTRQHTGHIQKGGQSYEKGHGTN